MKKRLLAFALLIGLPIGMAAQQASGTCTVSGTNNFVQADFYQTDDGGNIVIANQSEKPLTVVTVKVTATYSKGYVGEKKGMVLFNGSVYDINPYSTRKKDVTYTDAKKYSDFKVEVFNAICKQ